MNPTPGNPASALLNSACAIHGAQRRDALTREIRKLDTARGKRSRAAFHDALLAAQSIGMVWIAVAEQLGVSSQCVAHSMRQAEQDGVGGARRARIQTIIANAGLAEKLPRILSSTPAPAPVAWSSPDPAASASRRSFVSTFEARAPRELQCQREDVNRATGRPLLDLSTAVSTMEQRMEGKR